MDFNTLIGMDIERAEILLADNHIKFNTVVIDTFKLDSHDCKKVVKYSLCKDGLTLYLCKFKCGIEV